MIVLVVGLLITVWILAMVIVLGLCRAAAIGDRMREAQSARWLAERQRERNGGRSA